MAESAKISILFFANFSFNLEGYGIYVKHFHEKILANTKKEMSTDPS